MIKKVIAIATLLCALPMLANAGVAAWKLNTWVKSQGGNMVTSLPGGPTTKLTQTVTNGSVFKTYTSTYATVTVTPQSGWSISNLTRNGIVQTLVNPATAYSTIVNGANQSVYATFARTAYTLSAVAEYGGTVNTATISPVYRGAQLPPKSFIFTPAPGYAVESIVVEGGYIYNTDYQFVNATTGNIVTLPADPGVKVKLNIVNVKGNATIEGSFAVVGANAGNNQSRRTGQTVTLDGSASTGATSYTWEQVSGTPVTLAAVAGQPAKRTFVAPATPGNLSFKLTINGGSTSYVTVYVTTSNTETAKNVCVNCHTGQGIGGGTSTGSIYQMWSSSTHKRISSANCYGCHSGANTGSHPGQVQCISCHDEGGLVVSDPDICAHCHSANGNIHAVSASVITAKLTAGDCIGCHSVAAPNHDAALVNDNNGVRAITSEFQKWSHHVTGVALNNAHCAACHLAGTVSGTSITVDAAKHMVDNKTHLRNADSDADFAWQPDSPNHAGMDTFCLSCHDANGATSAGSVAIQGLINAAGAYNTGKTASAGNPFGDTISNQYDKQLRPRVVDAAGQFATSNPSHHAVLGAKYTGRTRADGDARQIASPSTFAQHSSYALNGKRQTLYDAGKLTNSYNTLSPVGTDYSIGDDSVLHCGDCHTVGQYRAADVGVLSKNAAVIGAHGSNNEYMLRNYIGTDERHVGQTYIKNVNGTITITNAGAPYLVCFNCHAYTTYGTIGNATGPTGSNHAGEYANEDRCNGPYNTITAAGFVWGSGFTELGDGEEGTGRLGLNQNPKGSDFSNIFGIQCANCHNSGPNNGFGGIHGSKITTYLDAQGSTQYAYRFLPGLGNTKYVPGSRGTTINNGGAIIKAPYNATTTPVSDINWEQKYLNNSTAGFGKLAGSGAPGAKSDNQEIGEGCYTIVPETAGNGPAGYSQSPAYEQEIPAGVRAGYDGTNDSAAFKIFGQWGGCDDHRGNTNGLNSNPGANGTTNTGGAGVTRKVVRPVSY